MTGHPVFLRMVIEDGEGRALKFRTRTRSEYARIRPGMAAEAVLVRVFTFIRSGLLVMWAATGIVFRAEYIYECSR